MGDGDLKNAKDRFKEGSNETRRERVAIHQMILKLWNPTVNIFVRSPFSHVWLVCEMLFDVACCVCACVRVRACVCVCVCHKMLVSVTGQLLKHTQLCTI